VSQRKGQGIAKQAKILYLCPVRVHGFLRHLCSGLRVQSSSRGVEIDAEAAQLCETIPAFAANRNEGATARASLAQGRQNPI
jgi:hypothetical protein